MEDENSTPEAGASAAGGNEVVETTDDHSQDDSTTEADNKTSENTEGGDASVSKDAPAKFDSDLDEWAEKHGHEKPDNDKERKLLQTIRNGQRDFSREKQTKKAADDLQKGIEEAKPEVQLSELEEMKADIRSEKVRARQREYIENPVNGVTNEHIKLMGDILKEKIDKAPNLDAKKAIMDYWTDPENLADWHGLAVLRSGKSVDNTQIEEQAAQKERERIAKETNAKAPNRNASATTATAKTEEQQRLERFSHWD